MSLCSRLVGFVHLVRNIEDFAATRSIFTLISLCCMANFLNSVDRILMPIAIIQMTDKYNWNLHLQGWILSAFSCGFITSQIIASPAANKFGGKQVLAFALTIWSLASLAIPLVAHNLLALICTRIVIGIVEGLILPTIYHMFAHRVPANERSRAFGYLAAAGSISQVFTALLSPHLPWKLMFYSLGSFGLLWVALWLRLYPALSITESIDHVPLLYSTPNLKSIKILQFFNCWPAWAIYIASFSQNWSNYIILIWLPTYLSRNLGADRQSISLTAIAYFINSICGVFSGHVADSMIASKWSILAVRRWMTVIGLMGPGICLLCFAFLHSLASAIIVISIAMAFCAFNSAGHLSNHADIAPNHAGMTFAISNTIATIPGILCGPITAELVGQSQGRWFPVFALAASINFAGAAIYASQSSDRPQWGQEIPIDYAGPESIDLKS